jgi:hypothetical protein
MEYLRAERVKFQSRTASASGAILVEPRIPAGIKIGLCAFLTILIPFYWYAFGGGNFLYFCDVVLFLAVWGIVTERSLPVSTAAVGGIIMQWMWTIDVIGAAGGAPVINMTAYMLQPGQSRTLRALEMFHAWLPFLILYSIWKLGYDRRAFLCWTLLASSLLTISYLFYRAPGSPPGSGFSPVNLNFVHGPSLYQKQTWMPGWMWLALLYVGLPLVAYLPTHLVLSHFMPQVKRRIASISRQP